MYLIIFNIILILILVIFFNYKYKKDILPTKTNEILKEILGLSIQESEDLQSKASAIIEILKRFYYMDYCSIFLYDKAFSILTTNVNLLYHESLESYVNSKNNLNCDAEVNISKDGLDYNSAEKRSIKYSYFIPLTINNRIIGAILIENTEIKDKYEKEIFSVVIEAITIVLQNLLYYKEISDLALIDPLTKVFNRNYMYKHLTEKIRKDKRFFIAIGDIDNFKMINDTYGHASGDVILKEVAKIISGYINSEDRVYRFGGEEFIIYLEDKNIEQGRHCIDNIRKKIEDTVICSNSEVINATISFGCYYPGKKESIESMIDKADKALYESKSSGKNKVSLYNT